LAVKAGKLLVSLRDDKGDFTPFYFLISVNNWSLSRNFRFLRLLNFVCSRPFFLLPEHEAFSLGFFLALNLLFDICSPRTVIKTLLYYNKFFSVW
jgi:hypothetical protein